MNPDPEATIYQFINYLKLSMKDVLKIKMNEQVERSSSPEIVGVFIGNPSANIEDVALSSMANFKMRQRLNPVSQVIWDLQIQGYSKKEILKITQLSDVEYRNALAQIKEIAEKIYEHKFIGTSNAAPITPTDIVEMKRLFEQKGQLLSPIERSVAELIFSCPEKYNPYDYVVTKLGLNKTRVSRIWYCIRKTLLGSKPDSNRHGRRNKKGPEIKKIQLARTRLVEVVFEDPEKLEKAGRMLSTDHFAIVTFAYHNPESSVKQIAQVRRCSRHVVNNAFEKLLSVFSEDWVTIFSQC